MQPQYHTMYILNPDPNELGFIRSSIRNNDGYCPCSLDRSEDTKCPCLAFRSGEGCQCGLYIEAPASEEK